jgi:hypothetical protein
MAQCSRILVVSAALLLLGNLMYSRENTVTTVSAPPTRSLELHGAASAAAAATATKRRIAELETELSELRGPAPAAKAAAPAVSSALESTVVQRPPQSAAVTAAAIIEVHMPPPPPPLSQSVEVVPLAERVEIPEGEEVPDALRVMRKGTDLFISFSSANMAPFALNWVANLRRAGIGVQGSTNTQVLIGALDDKMEKICKEQGVYVLPIQANLPGVNLRFDCTRSHGSSRRCVRPRAATYKRGGAEHTKRVAPRTWRATLGASHVACGAPHGTVTRTSTTSPAMSRVSRVSQTGRTSAWPL